MAQFHFVEDYEQHVAAMKTQFPLDEAMANSVGGDFYGVGENEAEILRWAGLRDGMTIFDLGCGCGRLSWGLGQKFKIEFTGTDVVQDLLDYAAIKSPPNYRFILHKELSIPMPDQSCDFVTAFSVFTHLLPSESFLYMREARRVLKPSGKLVFSFLEVANPGHWGPFMDEVEHRKSARGHLNMLLERPMIQKMARESGFYLRQFVNGWEIPWGLRPLGQSIAVLSLA